MCYYQSGKMSALKLNNKGVQRMVATKFKKKLISLSHVLVMIISVLATIPTASAATYTFNTGVRDVVCTSLSSKAKSYYTGSYVYSTLAKNRRHRLSRALKR